MSVEHQIVFSYDASRKEAAPDIVVIPDAREEVVEIVKIANQYKLPLTPRGAGSGLTGGAIAAEGGIVIDMSRLNKIIEIDPENLLAVVEPGVVTHDLRIAAEQKGLLYPPDPASMTFSTIGGNIAENAGGMSAVKYGVTKNFVMGLEVILPEGDLIQIGSKCIKDVVGYDLMPLFIGSEGTLGIFTKAILRLVPLPETTWSLSVTFASMADATKTVADITKHQVIPTTIEFMDKNCIKAIEQLFNSGFDPQAEALILIDIDGSLNTVEHDVKRVDTICRANHALTIQVSKTAEEREELWRARRSLHTATARFPLIGDDEDIVVPRSRIPDMLQKMQEITKQYGLDIVSFGHAGDGNIHFTMIEGDVKPSLNLVNQAKNEILQAAVALEGRIAAEHGIGLVKRDKLGLNLDPPTIEFMKKVKAVLDPNNILNPHKIFPTSNTHRW